MYIFYIKNEGPQLDILVTRALLGLSAVACIFFGNHQYRLVDYLIAVILLILAVVVRRLIYVHQVKRIVILIGAAVLLFVGTGSFFFAAILVLYGIGIKFLYPKNEVKVGEEGVALNQVFSTRQTTWDKLNNLVLKDNLLTVDYKNNKLLQLTTVDTPHRVNEEEFNNFCKKLLAKNVNWSTEKI